MPSYKLTGFLREAARILVFKEADWSIEKTESLPEGNFILGNLSAGNKMIAGRNIEGKVEVYGNVVPELQAADDYLMINASGDLLLINTAGDYLITAIG
jgi:hypothetical protein